MKGIQFQNPAQTPSGQSRMSGNAAMVAGTAAVIATIALGIGQMAYVEARVRLGATGVNPGTVVNATYDHTSGIFTSAAHGMSTGQAVLLGGTAVPSGLSATTTYYVIKIDANTYKLASSATNANSATAIAAGTDNGTAVTVTAVVSMSFYKISAIVRNRSGITTVEGTDAVTSFADTAETAATIRANNTTDRAELYVTPDLLMATNVEWDMTILTMNNK